MNIAREAATRSTCDRKHVGAVIVREGRIIGFEALVRGPEGSMLRAPEDLFAAAHDAEREPIAADEVERLRALGYVR